MKYMYQKMYAEKVWEFSFFYAAQNSITKDLIKNKDCFFIEFFLFLSLKFYFFFLLLIDLLGKNKENCMFPVTPPTLILPPDPRLFFLLLKKTESLSLCGPFVG